MDTNYITELNNALHRLESIKASQEQHLCELKQYDNILLMPSVVNNTYYYYSREKGQTKRRYLGNESNTDVCAIKENRFIHQFLKDINSEIDLMKALLSNHKNLDPTAVNARLPRAYQSATYAGGSTSSRLAETWLAEMRHIKSQYPIKNPEGLKIPAIDGTLMRSKSEVIIANLLISNNIPYIYELPLIIKGRDIRPDFTILSLIDYKKVIRIEHEGMMDQSVYQKVFLTKVNTFLSADMIPGRDIFFTFDDLHGVFDASTVQDIIDTRLKPRNTIV